MELLIGLMIGLAVLGLTFVIVVLYTHHVEHGLYPEAKGQARVLAQNKELVILVSPTAPKYDYILLFQDANDDIHELPLFKDHQNFSSLSKLQPKERVRAVVSKDEKLLRKRLPLFGKNRAIELVAYYLTFVPLIEEVKAAEVVEEVPDFT